MFIYINVLSEFNSSTETTNRIDRLRKAYVSSIGNKKEFKRIFTRGQW